MNVLVQKLLGQGQVCKINTCLIHHLLQIKEHHIKKSIAI